MYSSQGDAVREWLEGYRREESELDELIDRVRELRGSATSIRAQEITDMPKGKGSDDPLCDYVIQLERLEGNMERRLELHERDREALVDLTRKIKRKEDKEVIKCRYLFGMEWAEIRFRIYGRQKEYAVHQERYDRRMYRAHNRAIEWMGKNWSIK